jgi:hypothetical protein
MRYSITEENGIYDINVLCEDTLNNNETKQIGNLLIDTKRNQYYILPGEEFSDENNKNYFKNEMIDIFLSKLCDRVDSQSMVGEVKYYAKDVLNRLVLEQKIETEESKFIKDYEEDLYSYNKELISEESMFGMLR